MNATADIKAPMSCVIYIRISKDRDDETSTATQLAQCEAYAASKGWRIVGTFRDEGRSAFRKKALRPGFEAAMSHIENRTAGVLLVWKLNRYMRDADEFMVNWNRIQKAGAEFASVTESFDTTNAWGKIGLYIMASVAEIESEIKSDQAKAWHEQRRNPKTGNPPPPTGPRPYGYQRIKNGLTIDPTESAIVRQMAATVLATSSVKGARAELNSAGVVINADKAQTDHGNNVSLSGIKRILTNPTTAGLRKVGNDYVTGSWEPIIDRETWERLCVMLNDPARRTSFTDGKVKYLLVGIMQCAECKRPMHSRTHKNGMRYACQCGQSIGIDLADEAVSDAVLSMLDKQAWNALRIQGRTTDPAVTERVARELDELQSMLEHEEITFAEWQGLRRTVNKRLEAATTQTAVVLPDVDDVRKAWRFMSVAHKRMVVSAAFEHIECANRNVAGEGRSRITVD